MKIVSLLLLLTSFQALAGFDWQYSIMHPDGRIETKNIKDTEGFFFQVGEHLCSVSESEDDDDYYDFKCLNPKGAGVMTSIGIPKGREDYTRIGETFSDKNNKSYRIEILAFNYFSKKVRKPFSDDTSSREY